MRVTFYRVQKMTWLDEIHKDEKLDADDMIIKIFYEGCIKHIKTLK